MGKLQVNPLRRLPQDRYIAFLERMRALIAQGRPLATGHSEEIGDKYTFCTWGLCADDATAWPDPQDHTWPGEFTARGRVAPLWCEEEQRCPLDGRSFGSDEGCFGKCQVFQATKRHMRPETALRRYDEMLARVKK